MSTSTASAADPGRPLTVFIGTYTRGWACPPPAEKGAACTSKGIYAATFDPSTGALGPAKLVAETENPSYLLVHPNSKVLYAVNEIGDWKGDQTGAVSAFEIGAGGKLELINQVRSNGADPCHLSLTAAGKNLLVANYSGGNVSAHAVAGNGGLSPGNATFNEGDHGPHKNQDAAHAHFAVEGPRPNLVYVADLGLDKVMLYDLDPATSKLAPHAGQPFASVPPGGGPRHIAIAPSGKFLYTNNELSAAISVFARDPQTGALTQPALQTLSTLPAPHKGRHDNAALKLSPDGRFAFVSNRGHDSITTFAIDAATGKLKLSANVKSGGKEPRDLQIDPTGQFLFAMHQISDEIVVFRIDGKTGKLTKMKNGLKVSKPVNVAFWAGGK
jgi:6-phosphogluconolactonase